MKDSNIPCPHCGEQMNECDYSPLYGASWIHPKSTSRQLCEWSEKLIFECHIKSFKDSMKAEEHEDAKY